MVTCSATDAAGNTGSCSFLVIVKDTQLPVITCPSDMIVSNTTAGAAVAVNFSVSAADNCDGNLSPFCTPASGSLFPVGTNIVSCVAVDSSGNTNTCAFKVIVVKPPPPITSVVATPSILWPPNHEMISVTITVVASGSFTSRLYSVTSSDPTNTTGDGNTGGDWFFTGPLTLQLPAERASQSVGRVYTITIKSTDAAGNVIFSTVTVTVPPNQ